MLIVLIQGNRLISRNWVWFSALIAPRPLNRRLLICLESLFWRLLASTLGCHPLRVTLKSKLCCGLKREFMVSLKGGKSCFLAQRGREFLLKWWFRLFHLTPSPCYFFLLRLFRSSILWWKKFGSPKRKIRKAFIRNLGSSLLEVNLPVASVFEILGG